MEIQNLQKELEWLRNFTCIRSTQCTALAAISDTASYLQANNPSLKLNKVYMKISFKKLSSKTTMLEISVTYLYKINSNKKINTLHKIIYIAIYVWESGTIVNINYIRNCILFSIGGSILLRRESSRIALMKWFYFFGYVKWDWTLESDVISLIKNALSFLFKLGCHSVSSTT